MSTLYVNTITPNSGDTVTVSGSLTTTGKLTIGDATSDTVVLTAEISSSIIPDADDTYDLGSSANEWKDLYVDGTANIDTVSSSVVQIDNINIDGNTIKSTAGTDLNITPLAGQQIVLDGAVNVDAGVVSGVTHLTTTILSAGSASIDNIHIDGNTISTVAGTDLNITPLAGQQIVLDGAVNVDAGVVTGVTSLSAASASIGHIKTDHGNTGAAITSCSVSLLPSVDDTYDLGSSATQWKDLYIDGTANIDTLAGVSNITATRITASGNVDFNGDLDVDGTTNLDVVDIDGAVNMASTITIAGNITSSGHISASGLEISGVPTFQSAPLFTGVQRLASDAILTIDATTSLVIFAHAGGSSRVITMPAAVVGRHVKIIWEIEQTTSDRVLTCAGSDDFIGAIFTSVEGNAAGDGDVVSVTDGTVAITLVDDINIGSELNCYCGVAGQWIINGQLVIDVVGSVPTIA